MKVTIWHNPRCSKSRATLKLLEEKGIAPDVRLYLQDAPNADELREVLQLLGVKASELVRKGEDEYKLSGLSQANNDADLIDAMAVHPKLIERPVVIANGKAKIGRPPDAVLEIL